MLPVPQRAKEEGRLERRAQCVEGRSDDSTLADGGVLGLGASRGSYLWLLRRLSLVARLFTGVAWLFAIATVGALIANEVSDDPEYYVPFITGLIAAASVLLAWQIRRKTIHLLSPAPRRLSAFEWRTPPENEEPRLIGSGQIFFSDEEVSRLPERKRLIVTLYSYEGLSPAEIGSVLDVAESEIIRELGELFGDEDDEGWGGTREPRRPDPDEPATGLAIEEPRD